MRKIVLIIITIVLSFNYVVGNDNKVKFYNPSFSCDNVKKDSVEYMICSDEELSKFDRELSKQYKKTINNSQVDLKNIKLSQKNWLIKRNECKDIFCIKKYYMKRIEFFSWVRYQIKISNKKLFPKNGYSKYANYNHILHKKIERCHSKNGDIYIDGNYYVKYDLKTGSLGLSMSIVKFFDNKAKAVGYLNNAIGDNSEYTGTPVYILTKQWKCK